MPGNYGVTGIEQVVIHPNGHAIHTDMSVFLVGVIGYSAHLNLLSIAYFGAVSDHVMGVL